MPDRFFKKHKSDKIWWVNTGKLGVHEFTFDKETIFNLYQDYDKLTNEQKYIFAKENPFLAYDLFGKDDEIVFQAMVDSDN